MTQKLIGQIMLGAAAASAAFAGAPLESFDHLDGMLVGLAGVLGTVGGVLYPTGAKKPEPKP